MSDIYCSNCGALILAEKSVSEKPAYLNAKDLYWHCECRRGKLPATWHRK